MNWGDENCCYGITENYEAKGEVKLNKLMVFD